MIWLTCIIGMHIVIGLTMGLYLFSLIMIILNLAAFGPAITRTQLRTYQPEAVGKRLMN